MSAKTVQIPLNAAEFAFTYKASGRQVAEPTDLAPRMPGAFYGNVANAEFGVPQLLYCENVLPMAAGLYSVGYGTQITAYTGPVTDFDQAMTLRDANENLFTFSPGGGKNYVLNSTSGAWTSVGAFTFTNYLVTHAYVNGRTFICYEKTKIIEYNAGTGLFTTLSLTLPAGVTIANIRGIFGSSNYLLFFTDITVYWSTPANVLDFATVDQGAGQQTPLDVKGQITCGLPCAGGFIVYTARNAVGATFTNNGNSPFVFKEVANAGGVPSWERVTASADGNSGHYAFTSAGLQKLNLSGADTLYPEATDFLVGNQYERWNQTTKLVDTFPVGGAFSVKLAFLANRFLIISYGTSRNEFEDALVLDTSLERWGKLRVNHVDCFLYAYPTLASSYDYSQLPGLYSDMSEDSYADLDSTRLQVTPAKRGIAFLKSNGQVDILATDFAQTSTSGLAIFGRIEQNRQRMTTLTNVELDGLRSGNVYSLPSEKGKNRDSSRLLPQVDVADDYVKCDEYFTARNFDIAVEGTFMLSNLQARVRNHGYR